MVNMSSNNDKIISDAKNKIKALNSEMEKVNRDHNDLQVQLDMSMQNFNDLQETYDCLYKRLPSKQEQDLIEKLKSFKAFKNQSITLKFDNKMNFTLGDNLDDSTKSNSKTESKNSDVNKRYLNKYQQ